MSLIFKNPDTELDKYTKPTRSFGFWLGLVFFFFFGLQLIFGSQRKEPDSLSDLSIFTDEYDRDSAVYVVLRTRTSAILWHDLAHQMNIEQSWKAHRTPHGCQ